jgi:hypothetical protein
LLVIEETAKANGQTMSELIRGKKLAQQDLKPVDSN